MPQIEVLKPNEHNHDWLLNCAKIKLGTIRQCRRCEREEMVYYETMDGKVGWVLLDKKSRI